ncbi:FAD-dependent monooxygenase [Cognatishimia sp. F0-27]|uniref:FAD-dependent monooxygenase n=1 Tax=Cognatishimia sp. F0-27 TaxID=2816855 RepID=UPI001D0CAA3C|nr:FAD-dependent monooxygenase [Cognatishimia sp. F0-27]MCC1492341.1 FAD-dependent monooxygenase [Cognatishimia sp. F0-27]
MAVSGMQVVVLGGGIGGLATALAAARRGAWVTVFEQAPEIAEVGAGLQISPNGARVLQALGVAQAVADRAVRGAGVSLRDYREGREVVRLDLMQLGADQAYHFVHRADLIAALEAACREAGVEIRLGQCATSVAPGIRPAFTLDTQRHQDCDLIVGADGLHSVVRPALNGAAAPFFTGQVAWRALAPNSVVHPPEARVTMAPGRHVVSYPLRDKEVVNLVAVEEREDWVEEGWHHAGDPDVLRQRFGDFGGDVARLFQDVDSVGVWGLFRHPVAERWFAPGAALVGDAAHPTLPFLAQGAVMALEDAWALMAMLDAHDAREDGLARYQALRRDRVSRVIKAANGNAWKYHLRNPLLRKAAHLGLAVAGRVAPRGMMAQFDWIYRYDVTQERV